MKRKSHLLALLALTAVAGCDAPSLMQSSQTLTAPEDVEVATLDPTPPPPPPPTARTVAEFDTTTDEDRAAALNTSNGGEASLGTTLATLGSPAEPGIWLKTPLVDTLTAGRVTYKGASVNVDLRPSGGVAGSGSQISLPAMRLLGAPLTGIIELGVYAIR